MRVAEALDIVEHVGPCFVASAIDLPADALGLQKLSTAALSQTLQARLIEQTVPRQRP
jgi:hypothetical protein